MKVTNKIDIHLDDLRHIPPINVMQADAYTRVLEFSLYSGGVAWNVPEGVDVAVAYIGSSGKGIYDTLPDGTAACDVNGNVVTAVVAPQAVAMDGNTNLNIIFTDDAGHQLAAFCVTLKVERNPAVNATKPPDYINLRQWLSKEIRELLTYYVHVEPDGDGGYFTDSVMDDILQACASDAPVICRLELPMEPENLQLPLSKYDDSTAYFSAVFEGKEYLVTISADGVTVEQSEVGSGGGSGNPGEDGGYYTPTVIDNGDGTMTVSFAASNADMPAVDTVTVVLPEGQKGYSPTANVEQTDSGAIIHIYDKNGHTFATVENGKNGGDGKDGNGIASAVLNDDYTLTLTFDDGTNYTTPSIRGATGATGPQGPQGKQGETGAQGDPGYTPVRGVDYYTDADKAEFSTYIASELAKRGQLKPEYANSIKECTDTTKLYVLPDGFIYAYMTKTVTVNPTNQIRESINSDKTPYTGENGEDGYKVGYRFSNSTGTEVSIASYAVTGFIPCTVNDVIRTKNIEFDTASANSQIHFYDSNFAHILYIAGGSTTNSLASILNSNGNIEGSIAQSTNTLTDAQKSSIAYIRIAGLKFGDSAMVTLNEPLEATTTTTTAWYNSGHAFVPADYEDRIVDLEASAEELDERTSDLETAVELLSSGGGNIPEYVEGEAERVAGVVQAKRTVGSLTFTAMSDPHVAVDVESTYGLENNLTSCRDAGLGLRALQKHFKLDFAAMLGDYTYVGTDGTIEQAKKDISYFRNCMADGIKGIPSVWCTGNHDINYGANSDRRMTEDELYAYITGNNNGTTQDGDNIGRNYGYIDFENQKIRCVYLNTIDALDYPDNTDGTADDAMEITAVQARWLVDVGLDLSDKPNPTEWGVVLFSHHCLCQFPPVTAILTAYKDGASGSTSITTNGVTTVVDYDFTSANRGEIICAIHGHDHNFTYRKISSELWYQVTEANAWLWSICVPNVDTTRNNEKATNTDENYKNVFGEFDSSGNPVYYHKTQGTATSTSFCIITIDRKNRKIHAIHYGAGIDREISY